MALPSSSIWNIFSIFVFNLAQSIFKSVGMRSDVLFIFNVKKIHNLFGCQIDAAQW